MTANRRKRMKYVLAFLFLFEAGGVLAAHPVKSGHVNFIAKGNPGFMKIEGKSEKGLSGQLDLAQPGSPGVFEFDLNDIETGIELRDEHMKEKYFEVKKYPKAKLEMKSISGGPDLDSESKGAFSGTLTLHGVSRDVTGEYSLVSRKVSAKFPLRISDYKIDVPSWMGVTVADQVDVVVNAEF